MYKSIALLTLMNCLLLSTPNLLANKQCGDLKFDQPEIADFKTLEPKDAKDEDGYLASAKEIPLTTENILSAYKNGAFPWNSDSSGQVGWYSPPNHGVIPLKPLASFGAGLRGAAEKTNDPAQKEAIKQQVKREKDLRKAWNYGLNRNWTITFNKAFERVVLECARAKRNGYSHVWLVEEVQSAFAKLHKEGHAHSVEVWNEKGELIGGTYGIYRKGVFSGESVFGHMILDGEPVRVNNAGKVAIYAIIKRLYATGHSFIDTQTVNPTTSSLYGAEGFRREDYKNLVVEEEQRLLNKENFEMPFGLKKWDMSEQSWMPEEMLRPEGL